MDRVLQPFGDPVPREGNEDYEPNDGRGATIPTSTACRVVAWLILDVYGDESDTEVRSESCCDEPSKERNEVDVAELLRYVDRRLQHQDGEGDTRDPGVEAIGCE